MQECMLGMQMLSPDFNASTHQLTAQLTLLQLSATLTYGALFIYTLTAL